MPEEQAGETAKQVIVKNAKALIEAQGLAHSYLGEALLHPI